MLAFLLAMFCVPPNKWPKVGGMQSKKIARPFCHVKFVFQYCILIVSRLLSRNDVFFESCFVDHY